MTELEKNHLIKDKNLENYSLDEVLKKSNIRVKWNEKFDAVQKAKKEFLNLRIAK